MMNMFRIEVHRFALVQKESIRNSGCLFRRRFSSSSGSHKRSQDELLRNAQASETFRSAFFDGIKAQNRVSSEDIDDMMASNRARPSAILPAYQMLGLTLGLVARFAPQDCRKLLEKSVHSATVQQFNDSIRNIQNEGNDSSAEDTKETLKYHRDLPTDISDDGIAHGAQEEAESLGISGTGVTVSTALYHVLRASRKV
jgi:hypothetical protein